MRNSRTNSRSAPRRRQLKGRSESAALKVRKTAAPASDSRILESGAVTEALSPIHDHEQVLAFGPFQLFRARKMLLENGREVRLGSRAIDLLIALVERAGEVVGKNELISYVWPSTIVEDNNLRVHIASIRKRLGEGQADARYIVNVAGRGYSFVAAVNRSGPVSAGAPSLSLRSNLPAPISRPVGRAHTLKILKELVAVRRLVTIVGPAGIGKSTVALAVAESVTELFNHRVFFADLAVATNVPLAEAALASALGISVHTNDPIGSLVANLRDARVLIVLDNCEHVIAGVADLAQRVLREARGVSLLATSREPLLLEGEQIHQLAPLACPAEFERLSAAQALEYPAVQLFAERALVGSENFSLTDANAAAVATLCRRLDGVPLAIEIVAARAGLVGLTALGLESDRADLLCVAGRRTASARHNSLGAALTWSYEHLSPIEQSVLQRLSVFAGWFSATAAVAVASCERVDEAGALEALMSLAAKSLLSTDISEPEFRYRLLHVTRVYAAALLSDSGCAAATSRRHAHYYCGFLEGATRDGIALSRARWILLHQSSIDDIRAALEWAFSSGGDEALGVNLTVAAVTFGFQLSLIDEFKKRIEVALAAARRFAVAAPDLEARLTLALANLRMRSGESIDALDATMDRVVALTKESGVTQNIFWPLTNRVLIPLDFGDHAGALESFAELEAAAKKEDDPFASLTADRVGAMVCHWAGQHTRARVLAERALRHPAHRIPLVYSPISVDRRVSMRMVLSRILWIEGFADQAQTLAAEALELAGSDSPAAVCDVLGHAAVPIAFWRGDLSLAAAMTEMLMDRSRRYTMTRWYIAAQCFKAVLALSATSGAGAIVLDDELERATPLPGLQRDLLATMSDRWIDATTIERGARCLAGWCSPELLRASGELQLISNADNAASLAETAFVKALQCAREQQALAWELRSASSLARLWMSQGRRKDAELTLLPVYRRFREGARTADVIAARSILEKLGA